MIRAFIDSSVIFSASYSGHGYSRDIILLAIRGELQLVISKLVLAETALNLEKEGSYLVNLLGLIVENIPFEYVHPTKKEVLLASKYVLLKDAAIVAAAKKAKVDYLITLDKKHLLGKPNIARFIGADIVTPKEAVGRLKRGN